MTSAPPVMETGPARTRSFTDTVATTIVRALRSSVLLAILLSIVAGAVLMAVTGTDPLRAYGAILAGAFTGSGPANTLQRAVPLVGLAVALAIAFRAGAFNLGAMGQMVIGALAGTVVVLALPFSGPVAVAIGLIAAIVAGGVWALVPVVLELRFGAPLLISSLLLNYPAEAFVSFMVRFVLRDPQTDQVATSAVPVESRIPALIPATSDWGRALAQHFGGSNEVVLISRTVGWGIVIVAAIVIATVVYNDKTPSGLESRITGKGPLFARYAGIRTGRVLAGTMFASGGIAGLVGVMLVLGGQNRLIDGSLAATGYTWTALLVALLASSRPLATTIVGIGFAALIVGGEAAERSIGLSAQISDILQAALILLVTLRVAIPRVTRRSGGRDVRAAADDEKVGEL